MDPENLTVKKNGVFGGSVVVGTTTTTVDLTVSNNATVQNNLAVIGDTTVTNLDISGNLTAAQDVVVSGTLGVTDKTTLKTTVTGSLTSDAVTTSGKVSAGSLGVTGESVLAGLTAGTTTLGDTTAGATTAATLTSTGKATVAGDLDTNGGLKVTGDTVLKGLTAAATTLSSATIATTADVTGKLTVTGQTKLGDIVATELKTDKVNTGTLKSTGACDVATLAVRGNTALAGKLDCAGVAKFATATMGVGNLTTATVDNLNVAGGVELKSDLTVLGKITAKQTYSIGAPPKFTGGMTVTSTDYSETTGRPWLVLQSGGATVSPADGATLTGPQIRNGVFQRTVGAGSVTWKFDTGATIAAAMIPKMAVREMFKIMVINDSTGSIYLDTTATGVEVVGGGTASLTVPPKTTGEYMIYSHDGANAFRVVPTSVVTPVAGVTGTSDVTAASVVASGGMTSEWQHLTPKSSTGTGRPGQMTSLGSTIPEITATISANAVRLGYLSKTVTGMTTATLPTGAALDAAMEPRITSVGAMFTVYIANESAENLEVISPDATMGLPNTPLKIAAGITSQIMMYRTATNRYTCYPCISSGGVDAVAIAPAKVDVSGDVSVGGTLKVNNVDLTLLPNIVHKSVVIVIASTTLEAINHLKNQVSFLGLFNWFIKPNGDSVPSGSIVTIDGWLSSAHNGTRRVVIVTWLPHYWDGTEANINYRLAWSRVRGPAYDTEFTTTDSTYTM
ncbi:MAG: hypothetical protein KAG66_10715, partial [Methylococcales bacterium]|nr:hypothetical protein [Methylococcales bacterium]